jgi:hypothetical protein
MSSYSVEFGQEEYIMLYGIKTAKTIPFNWLQTDHNNATLKRGPSYCDMCKKDGMFEGIFYGLCTKCCTTNGFCPCVYCRVAKKDGHKRTERRINICNFIKTLQSAINDLRRDYPDDEYGIVKEGIETGYYILNLHTKYQYEKMELETEFPYEINKLDPDNVMWIWNTSIEVSDISRKAAIEASKRLGIYHWVMELWGEEENNEKQEQSQSIVNEFSPGTLFNNCGKCNIWMWSADGNICDECLKSSYNMDDYDIQCKECNTWVSLKEVDERNYCRYCQNPEYDPVWPLGD